MEKDSRKRQSPALHLWAQIHLPQKYSYIKIYFFREYHSLAREKPSQRQAEGSVAGAGDAGGDIPPHSHPSSC